MQSIDTQVILSEICETSELIQDMTNQLKQWNWLDTTGGSFSKRVSWSKDLFMLTPTHSGFEGWNIEKDGLIVLDAALEKDPSSTSQRPAHPSAIVHNHVYQAFPGAGAVIHTHSPNSLAFACARKAITPCTLHSQILGTVPCLTAMLT